jgi:hypothetical protein
VAVVVLMRPDAKRSGPPAGMGRPEDQAPTVSSAILPEPCSCACGCCAALIKALAGIRLELHQLNERMSQAESQQAWSA